VERGKWKRSGEQGWGGRRMERRRGGEEERRKGVVRERKVNTLSCVQSKVVSRLACSTHTCKKQSIRIVGLSCAYHRNQSYRPALWFVAHNTLHDSDLYNFYLMAESEDHLGTALRMHTVPPRHRMAPISTIRIYSSWSNT